MRKIFPILLFLVLMHPKLCFAPTYIDGSDIIDISDATNLTAGDHITLIDDDLNIDDDFLLDTGDIGTGVYDFGGATSLEIPNADDVSGNTTEGMISWDSNDDKLYMGNGVAVTEIGAGDLKADGTVPLTADWDAGNSLYDITAVEFKGNLIGNASGSSGSCTGNAATVTNGVYTSNNLGALATTTSAQLYGVLSDETGSASGTPLAVFNVNPTLTGAIVAGTLDVTGALIEDSDAEDLVIRTNSVANQLVLDSGGNVGIGTTAPDVNLDVEGSTGISIGEDKAGGTSNDEGILKLWSDGDNAYYTTIKTGTQTQNITYTLPLDDGDADQVLATNGAGVLDWTSAGVGDITAVGDGATGNVFTADGTGNNLYFEGTTANLYETILTAEDTTTADKTITLPNATGTVVLKDTTDTLTNKTLAAADNVIEADTVANATLTTALTVDTGTVGLTGNVANSSVLTLGAGASSVSGTNTGDNTVATSGDGAVDFFGAGVDAVTDTTTCTDLEGTKLSIAGGVLNCTETDPGLQTLTTAEVDQLEEIGAATVSSTQWGYLGAMGGQPLESEVDSVVAAINGLVKSDGTTIAVAVADTDYQSALSFTGTGNTVRTTSPTIGTPSLTLQDGNGAAPTADGVVKYDRTTETLEIGDGTNTRAIYTDGTIQFIFDGGGSAIAANSNVWLYMPYSGTLTGWDLTVDTSATIVIDCWDDTYVNFPPDNADAMPGAGKEPTITTAVKATDADISDWADYTITKGEYLKVSIDSNDLATWALLVLKVRKE